MSWTRIKAIARRHAYVLQRSPHRLFDVTIWPLVDVLMFGSLAVFLARASTTQAAFGYVLAGVLLWQIVYQSQISLSTGFLEETWSRNLLNLMVTPLREIEYVLGVALFGLVKLFMGLAVVTLTALLLYSFDISDLGWSLVPIAGVLLAVGAVISFFVIGLVLRFGAGAEALAWGLLFLALPLSGVFYPVAALPAILRPISQALPSTHAFEATRAVIDGRGIDWGQLGVAYALVAVALVVALAFLRRMLTVFRRRGYVTRYS